MVDGPPGISGSDVEKQIDNFFPAKDLMSLSSEETLPPDDEQTDENDEISEFYTIAGEDAVTAKMEDVPEQLDDVEFVDEVTTHNEMLETQEADMSQSTGEILPDVELFEEYEMETAVISPEPEMKVTPVQEVAPPDQRDKPFDIPEHVLTPTLADIYYQQGQYQLAQQIYTRLLEREPENEKLKKRMDEISVALKNQETGASSAEKPDTAGPPKKTSAKKAVVKKSASRKSSPRKEKSDDSRPLAGVHIRKRLKNAKKKPRKKS
jgi:hypothetical protein